MKFQRLLFVAALTLFVAWLGWLATAVFATKPTIVSRAQLTEATVLVVAELTVDDSGQPRSPATVLFCLTPDGPAANTAIDVTNLPAASVPGKPLPGGGQYLLPLVPAGTAYRIAGLPRSPGYDLGPTDPPLIYPWTADVQAQLKRYGYTW